MSFMWENFSQEEKKQENPENNEMIKSSNNIVTHNADDKKKKSIIFDVAATREKTLNIDDLLINLICIGAGLIISLVISRFNVSAWLSESLFIFGGPITLISYILLMGLLPTLLTIYLTGLRLCLYPMIIPVAGWAVGLVGMAMWTGLFIFTAVLLGSVFMFVLAISTVICFIAKLFGKTIDEGLLHIIQIIVSIVIFGILVYMAFFMNKVQLRNVKE